MADLDDKMYGCVVPSLGTTAVDLACFCRLLPPPSAKEKGSKAIHEFPHNLVTGYNNRLNIYNIHLHTRYSKRLQRKQKKYILEHKTSIDMAGQLVGITPISLSTNRPENQKKEVDNKSNNALLDSIDILILSFSTAKISICCYDPEGNDLVVLQLVNLEYNAIGPGSRVKAKINTHNVNSGETYDKLGSAIDENIESSILIGNEDLDKNFENDKGNGIANPINMQDATVSGTNLTSSKYAPPIICKDTESKLLTILMYGYQLAFLPLDHEVLLQIMKRHLLLSTMANYVYSKCYYDSIVDDDFYYNLYMMQYEKTSSLVLKKQLSNKGNTTETVEYTEKAEMEEEDQDQIHQWKKGDEDKQNADSANRNKNMFSGKANPLNITSNDQPNENKTNKVLEYLTTLQNISLDTSLLSASLQPYIWNAVNDLYIRGRIIDMCYLNGDPPFLEPALCILRERPEGFSGGFPRRSQTCVLSIYSCARPASLNSNLSATATSNTVNTLSQGQDTLRKRFNRLPQGNSTKPILMYHIPYLPHDSYAVYPLPNPHTGVLVLSSTKVVYVEQDKIQAEATGVLFNNARLTFLNEPPKNINETNEIRDSSGYVNKRQTNSKRKSKSSEIEPEKDFLNFQTNNRNSLLHKKKTRLYALICTNNHLGATVLLELNLEKDPCVTLSFQYLSTSQGLFGVTSLCTSPYNEDLCFIGSYLNDSFLFEIESTKAAEENRNPRHESNISNVEQKVKSKTNLDESVTVDEESIMLYGSTVTKDLNENKVESEIQANSRFRFNVIDSIPTFGPFTSCIWLGSNISSKRDLETYESVDDGQEIQPKSILSLERKSKRCQFISTSNFDSSSSLVSLTKGISFDLLSACPLDYRNKVQKIWTINSPSALYIPENSGKENLPLIFVILSLSSTLAIEKEKSSKALVLGLFTNGLKEVETNLEMDYPTLFIGTVLDGQTVLQIFCSDEKPMKKEYAEDLMEEENPEIIMSKRGGLYLIRSGEIISSMEFFDEEDIGGLGVDLDLNILSVSVHDPFIFIHLSDNRIRTIIMDSKTGSFRVTNLVKRMTESSDESNLGVTGTRPPILGDTGSCYAFSSIEIFCNQSKKIEDLLAYKNEVIGNKTEDEELYGHPDPLSSQDVKHEEGNLVSTNDFKEDVKGVNKYIAICRNSINSLEILKVTDTEYIPVFSCNEVNLGHEILRNNILPHKAEKRNFHAMDGEESEGKLFQTDIISNDLPMNEFLDDLLARGRTKEDQQSNISGIKDGASEDYQVKKICLEDIGNSRVNRLILSIMLYNGEVLLYFLSDSKNSFIRVPVSFSTIGNEDFVVFNKQERLSQFDLGSCEKEIAVIGSINPFVIVNKRGMISILPLTMDFTLSHLSPYVKDELKAASSTSDSTSNFLFCIDYAGSAINFEPIYVMVVNNFLCITSTGNRSGEGLAKDSPKYIVDGWMIQRILNFKSTILKVIDLEDGSSIALIMATGTVLILDRTTMNIKYKIPSYEYMEKPLTVCTFANHKYLCIGSGYYPKVNHKEVEGLALQKMDDDDDPEDGILEEENEEEEEDGENIFQKTIKDYEDRCLGLIRMYFYGEGKVKPLSSEEKDAIKNNKDGIDEKGESDLEMVFIMRRRTLGLFDGPVYCMQNIDNHTLIISMGNKLLAFAIDKEVTYKATSKKVKLVSIAEYYCCNYIVNNIKVMYTNGYVYLMVSDAYGSIQLFAWFPKIRTFWLLGKDHNIHKGVYSCDFLVRSPTFGMFLCDDSENLQILQFNETKQLIIRGDYFIGNDITFFQQCFGYDETNDLITLHSREKESKKMSTLHEQRDIYSARTTYETLKRKTMSSSVSKDNSQTEICNYLICGSVQGTLHTIKPLNDKAYRFLYILQFALTNILQHYGGCNPRQYRYYTPKSKFPVSMYSIGSNYHKVTSEPFSNMLLDGQLLLRYYTLPIHTQLQLAYAIGNTRSGVYSLLNKLIFV